MTMSTAGDEVWDNKVHQAVMERGSHTHIMASFQVNVG